MTEEHLTPLVKVDQHNIALLFTNYLKSVQIDARIREEDCGYVICCLEHQLAQAKQEFDAFIQQPYHPKYQQAAWQHGDVSQVSSAHPPLLQSFRQQFLAHAGLVTLVVFIACWLVFFASLAGWANEIFYSIRFYQELSLDEFLQAPYRIIGPAFFHFSWLHIVFNTMWWWQLGGSIEKALGKGALLNLFFVSAILSNVGQFIVAGENFGGLSGVVYGLVGYVWWYGWLAPKKGLTLSKPIIGILLFWLLLGYTEVLPFDMANTAHLLGLISGCVLAFLNIKTAKD
ncbi:rhomboid family intramembrane serine protease GlpG [Colwelliaceae bacterium 6471]